LTSYLPELTFKMRREKVGRKGGIEQGWYKWFKELIKGYLEMTEDTTEDKKERDDKKEQNWEKETQVIKNEIKQISEKWKPSSVEKYFTVHFSSYT
jgi:hypothetical protein